MSKNTGVVESIERTDDRIKDEAFKEIAKHKVVAALILKVTVSEFKGMSLLEIAKCIRNDNEIRDNLDDAAVINGEVGLLKTETGAGGEKEIRNDIVFAVDIPKKGIVQFSVHRTINVEMQRKVQGIGYDLKKRAIYYAASLLRDTIARGDKLYSNMHKVYSIWLCDDDISIRRWEETSNKYIHKFNMYVSYDDIPNKVGRDEDFDFMEVVFVELPKMKGKLLKEEDALVSLLYSEEDAIDKIEGLLPLKLERARKEIREAMNWEERTQRYVEEGKAEGMAEGKFISLDNLLQNNRGFNVNEGAALLGFGEKELEEYKKTRSLVPVE